MPQVSAAGVAGCGWLRVDDAIDEVGDSLNTRGLKMWRMLSRQQDSFSGRKLEQLVHLPL